MIFLIQYVHEVFENFCKDFLMKIEFDKFYTPESTVLECLSTIDFSLYGFVVEPAAGCGSFVKHIPLDDVFACDIKPDALNIVEQDFLSLKSFPNSSSPVLVVGNPPFGSRGSLAKRFIQHSIDLGADTIAFILPNTFRKFTNQRMFSSDWRLVCLQFLSSNVFEIFGNETIEIPCSWFVWTRLQVCSGVDLRAVRSSVVPKEFVFLGRGDSGADFCVNGNSGAVKNVADVTNPKSEHYIKVSEGFDVDAVREGFENLSFESLSSVSGGNFWLNRGEIVDAWFRKFS